MRFFMASYLSPGRSGRRRHMPRNQQGSHLITVSKLAEEDMEFFHHVHGKRIQAIRPVQCQEPNPGFGLLELYGSKGHGALLFQPPAVRYFSRSEKPHLVHANRLPVFERRFPLFHKGLHPFFLIRRGKKNFKTASLVSHGRLNVHIHPAIDGDLCDF